jgi:hypothetical protein
MNYPKVDVSRIRSALELCQSSLVHREVDPITLDYVYMVRSWSSKHIHYQVNLKEKSCQCKDHQYGNICKHRIAAYIYKTELEKQEARQPQPQPKQKVTIPNEILTELGY